jgi:hypothetical protein
VLLPLGRSGVHFSGVFTGWAGRDIESLTSYTIENFFIERKMGS